MSIVVYTIPLPYRTSVGGPWRFLCLPVSVFRTMPKVIGSSFSVSRLYFFRFVRKRRTNRPTDWLVRLTISIDHYIYDYWLLIASIDYRLLTMHEYVLVDWLELFWDHFVLFLFFCVVLLRSVSFRSSFCTCIKHYTHYI